MKYTNKSDFDICAYKYTFCEADISVKTMTNIIVNIISDNDDE